MHRLRPQDRILPQQWLRASPSWSDRRTTSNKTCIELIETALFAFIICVFYRCNVADFSHFEYSIYLKYILCVLASCIVYCDFLIAFLH